MLREYGAKNSLFHAADKGMLELMADLIKEGADVNEKTQVSLYRVFSAPVCINGYVTVYARHVLSLGTADRRPGLQDGYTSLHRATACGLPAVVQALLEHGADVAARDQVDAAGVRACHGR